MIAVLLPNDRTVRYVLKIYICMYLFVIFVLSLYKFAERAQAL